MSDAQGRSGIPPWLVAVGALLWWRSSTRRAAERARPPRYEAERFMRDIVTADGREALEVQAVLYEPDPTSLEQWVHVRVEGSQDHQQHLLITQQESADNEVVVILVPLGTRRRVNVVDCYLVGGVGGHLPPWAVARWGAQLRQLHLARAGQPSAVRGRIVVEVGASGTQSLALEVLMPETFETD
jgi:hypothetical protein